MSIDSQVAALQAENIMLRTLIDSACDILRGATWGCGPVERNRVDDAYDMLCKYKSTVVVRPAVKQNGDINKEFETEVTDTIEMVYDCRIDGKTERLEAATYKEQYEHALRELRQNSNWIKTFCNWVWGWVWNVPTVRQLHKRTAKQSEVHDG